MREHDETVVLDSQGAERLDDVEGCKVLAMLQVFHGIGADLAAWPCRPRRPL
ncbi:hypothetical protein HUT18_17260 [Streptomyces sp. NA04227]|uniref:hypothetical protein n=1 Tax=Streptomyces sp. NA04227 TaxID=2742136 RepID=UPI001590997C|nr:hypothetical protein [Streptomyces sp. NA04227]QKW07877.1 hypothetical protein HUT18_17260 [Streptomyces sp. NA04227]